MLTDTLNVNVTLTKPSQPHPKNRDRVWLRARNGRREYRGAHCRAVQRAGGFGESTSACLDTRARIFINTGIILLGYRSKLAFGKVGDVLVLAMFGRVCLCVLLSRWGLFSEN